MVNWTGYELIVGSRIDPQFGPVLLFGMGGQLVEVFKDRALGLPPLTTTLARRMMESTKISTALKGVRGPPRRRHGRARAAPRPLQRARRGAALDRGDRHQPAAGLAGAAHRPRRPRRPPRPGDRPEGPAAPGDPPVPAQVRQHVDLPGRRTCSRSGPIRPEDEPLVVRLPPLALAGDRLPAGTSGTSASTSAPPTSGWSGSASSTTTASWRSSPSASTRSPDDAADRRRRPPVPGLRDRRRRVRGPRDRRAPGRWGSGRSSCAASSTLPAPRAWRRSARTCAPTTSACGGRPRRSASRSCPAPTEDVIRAEMRLA